MATEKSLTSLFLISSLLLASCFNAIAASNSSAPIVDGLSWTFYDSSCPNLESIIRNYLQPIFEDDIGQAAGVLRLHFHDCFVQGCDGSVLLDGSASEPSEQDATPNLTLRKEAFQIINDLQTLVQQECGQVVSCADILTISARDSVYLAGGPDYDVPLGRRDSLNFASQDVTSSNLPAPVDNASTILSLFATKNLDNTDTVALSGAHTYGRGHCVTFTNRLYPTQDPTLDDTLAKDLEVTCPASDTDNTTILDILTPNDFDNKYYVNLENNQGLFNSDQDLYTDNRTKDIVTSFADNQTLFFEQFVLSMIKMGQVSVLTGTEGEIRANCSVINSDNLKLLTVVEERDSETLFELK